jgi:hypothetical protein
MATEATMKNPYHFSYVCSLEGCEEIAFASHNTGKLRFCTKAHSVSHRYTPKKGFVTPKVTTKAFKASWAKHQGYTYAISVELHINRTNVTRIADELKLKVIKKCEGCSKSFHATGLRPFRQTFCSKECGLVSRRAGYNDPLNWHTFIMRAKHNSKSRVTITKAHFLELKNSPCFYGGTACLEDTSFISIDRKNPLGTYRKGNCVCSCNEHNKAKGVVDMMAHKKQISGHEAATMFIELMFEVAYTQG